ncbi:MAG: hypothetical protein RL033_2772 [Pseudomonadota bacterium]|jgi:glutaredoxin
MHDAPEAPATVTDNPPSLRLSIRVHPLALVLGPVAVLTVLLFFVFRSGSERVSDAAPSAALAAAGEASAPAGAAAQADDTEDNGATDGDPAADVEPEPLLPLELAAKKTAELERLHAEAERKSEREQLLASARGRLKVQVYYKQDCNSCSEARRHLAALGVRAEEHDIDQEPRARARHRSLNPRGRLPTIEVEGKVLQGFQEQKLDRALERAATARLKRER